MVVKIYISGISGNKEVKKRQQRVLMILESKCIPYEVVDITEPGREADKDFMQTKATSLGATVSDLNPRHPLPPQIFNDELYCGDYEQFDMANEVDELEIFLKVSDVKKEHSIIMKDIPVGNGTTESVTTEPETIENEKEEEDEKKSEKNENENGEDEVLQGPEENEELEDDDVAETDEVEADVAA